MPRLEMIGVRKRFGATVALDGVDLAVAEGRVHALVGENGAGKSTLMKVLSGAVKPDAGQMLLDGESHTPRDPMHARRSGISMIYQELALCPHLSVEENILLGMEPSALGILKRREMRRRTIEALRQLEHAEIRPAEIVARLSTAQQQLVEIARAVAIGSRVLVLDEPTSSLTQQDVSHLFNLVHVLKRQGQAIVYISHFLEEVKQIADQFTVLRDGRSVGGGAIGDSTIPQIIEMMVGREVTELYPRSTRTAGEVVLDVSRLAGKARPLDASLQLRRGEILGIAGLIGAGRTELLRALFGLDPIRRGDVRLFAYHGFTSPARRWKQGAGLLSEDRKGEGLALGMSVGENLTMSRPRELGPVGLVVPSRRDARAQSWIQRLGIRCRSSRQTTGELSGGNQQKVALARLLHHDAEVLLLDEPTRGIDVASKADIYRIINDLAASGKAILMVSSYLPELLGVCDRIAVMCRGKLGPAHPVSQIDERQIMLEATGM